jgi:hypothetical protein
MGPVVSKLGKICLNLAKGSTGVNAAHRMIFLPASMSAYGRVARAGRSLASPPDRGRLHPRFQSDRFPFLLVGITTASTGQFTRVGLSPTRLAASVAARSG